MSKFQRIYWSKKFDWKHYSKLYDNYCKSKNNYYLQTAEILVNSIRLDNSSKVIDLACGTGALTSKLLKRYPEINIFAVDLSREMLSFYKKNFVKQINSGQIKVKQDNAEIIDRYINKKYDAIFISSALWDLEIGTTLRNCAKVLKKGGHIVFNLPALVVKKEKGFIFFIEHFFRQALNSNMIYRRIDIESLKKLFRENKFKFTKLKEYSFNMSKKNVAEFFNLLRYRYPFILFPKEIPYKVKLKRCTEIFQESLRYIPKEGIDEDGFLFIATKQ